MTSAFEFMSMAVKNLTNTNKVSFPVEDVYSLLLDPHVLPHPPYLQTLNLNRLVFAVGRHTRKALRT